MGLDAVGAGQVVPVDEVLYGRAGVPLPRGDLVASDVHVGVGEERGHLAEETVEEGVDLLLRRVEDVVEDPPFADQRERSGHDPSSGYPTSQLVECPGRSNSGRPGCAIPRVRDDVTHLVCV